MIPENDRKYPRPQISAALARVPGVAMKHDRGAEFLLVQDLQHQRFRLSRMDDQRQRALAGDGHLSPENRFLVLAPGKIVMKIKAHLAQGEDAGVVQESEQPLLDLRGIAVGLVRMGAGAGRDGLMVVEDLRRPLPATTPGRGRRP